MNVVCLRLAVRSLIRNRTQALFILLRAMIGVALITASLLLQHSIKLSEQDMVEEQLGPILVDVSAQDQMNLQQGHFTPADIVEMQRAHLDHIESKALQLLPTVSLDSTLMSEDGKRYSPGTYIQGFELGQAEKIDPQYVQALPRSVGPGEIALSDFAARKLEVQRGERIYAMDTMGNWQPFIVKDIYAPYGLTGYRGADQAKTTAIVSVMSARALAGIDPDQFTNVLFISDGEFSSRYTRSLPLPPDQWRLRLVRLQLEDRLSSVSKLLPIFLIAGIHAILIGTILITNVFRMMAEQRKQEWAILRAIGFTRNHIRRMIHYESLIYALVSGVIGCLCGAGLAYVLLRHLETLFQTVMEVEENIALSFRFAMHPGLLLIGFFSGALLIWFSKHRIARRITRLSIADSIQMRQQVTTVMNRRPTIFSQVRAPLILIAAMSLCLLLVAGPIDDRIVRSELAPLWYFMLGLLLISCCIAAVITVYRSVTNGWLKLLAPLGPWFAALKLALRYPQAQLSRTGWVMLMFALILYLTGFSSVFSQTMSQFFGSYQSRAATGGFDLAAEMKHERPLKEIEALLDEYDPALSDSFEAIVTIPQVRIYDKEFAKGMTQPYAEHISVSLRYRDSAYADDQAVWQALTQDQDVIVASEHFLRRQQVSYKIGDRIQLGAGESKIELRLIGIAEYTNENYGYPIASGVWVHPNVVERLDTQTSAISGFIGFKLHSNASGTEAAPALERALIPYGIDKLINPQENFAANSLYVQIFFSLFERFNLVATIIGIAGLMIMMLRVVQERRQEMGILRAMGIPSRLIFGSLLWEGAVISATGMICGFGIGVFIGYRMIYALSVSDSTPIFVLFPLSKLVIYLIVTIAATILSLLLPARFMMKQTPAEATRHAGH